MRTIRVEPLADESLGVRSMALLVEIGVDTILFDAGVSLAPKRYGLPPHPSELEALEAARKRILKAASKANVVFTSHYHKDHYTPNAYSLYEASSPDIFKKTYSGKNVIALDPNVGTTRNQVKRAQVFFRALAGKAKITRMSGGETYSLSEACSVKGLLFSHGEGKLGKVLAALLICEEQHVLLYIPDVQGPPSRSSAEQIVKLAPRVLVIGGPPLYLAGGKVSFQTIKDEMSNFAKIIRELGETGTKVFISHHILRDPSWEDALEEYGVERDYYSLYSDRYGREPELLEAYRQALYEYSPPPKDYIELLRRHVNSLPREVIALVKGKR